jgi:hypothetical protein
MIDKSEVVSFLRNQQKAAEIEAKVNGVNLWVLLGAIAIVVWQLVESLSAESHPSFELALRATLLAEAIYMWSWLWDGFKTVKDEIRFSNFQPSEMEYPFLVFVQGAVLAVPPALFLYIYGSAFAPIVMGVIGGFVAAFGVVSILSRIFGTSTPSEKLPTPDFGATKRADTIGDLVFVTVFTIAAYEQARALALGTSAIDMEVIKQLILIGTLYLLILVSAMRRGRANNLKWTYDLETELLLGSVTAEVALRRIEHRGLGPRLEDVMNRFFDDLDRRIESLNDMFAQCRDKLSNLDSVPKEFRAERESRIHGATSELKSLISGLLADNQEFGGYLGKLGEKNKGARKAILAPIIASLKARHQAYEIRIRAAESELREILR